MKSTIDYTICSDCGNCAETCPAGIIEINTENKIVFRDDRLEICIRCGHCMAVCPEKAVFVEGLDYNVDFFDFTGSPAGYKDILEFLQHRRSVRVFRNKPVSREIADKVIAAVSESPFGVAAANVHLSFVLDPEILKKSTPIISESYRGFRKMFGIAPFRWMMRMIMPLHEYNTLVNFIIPHMKKGLYDIRSGKDDILRDAPAMLLFHAPPASEEHPTDAIIYLVYAFLAVHSLGMGATVIGLVPPIVNRNKALKHMYGIPQDNRVIATMIFGYPKLHFKRGIRRPRKNVNVIE